MRDARISVSHFFYWGSSGGGWADDNFLFSSNDDFLFFSLSLLFTGSNLVSTLSGIVFLFVFLIFGQIQIPDPLRLI